MKTHIVGIGGTTRSGSSSERLVRSILSCTETLGARVTMFGASELVSFSHYSPSESERTPQQIAFIDAVRSADGVVIGSPGYHGGVSGLVKNAIDLLEDTNADIRPYFDGRPVGLAVAAAGWQAGGATLSALRSIVHAMRGWPTPLGVCINTTSQTVFNPEGVVIEQSVSDAIAAQAVQIMRLAVLTGNERRWTEQVF